MAVKHNVTSDNSFSTTLQTGESAFWCAHDSHADQVSVPPQLCVRHRAREAIEVASRKIRRVSPPSGNLWDLRISGSLYCSSWDMKSILPLQQSRLLVREFRFHMDWMFFDVTILKSIQPAGLLKLDIPVKAPEHLPGLGSALSSMSNLETLLLRDIPAREDFYGQLHCIGNGVKSLPRLKHLGVVLTNILRPKVWEQDDRFEKPANDSHFFDMVFPRETYRLPTPEEASLQLREEAKELRGEVHSPASRWRPPLGLSKLSLKHIDLPIHALETVFQPETLKDLDISNNEIHNDVPTQLRAAETKLKRITGVDYELLSPQFLSFLAVQDELEVVEFLPPTDAYVAEREPGMDHGTYQHWSLLRATEEQSASTCWSLEHNARDERGVAIYPGLEDPSQQFLQAMQNKPRLRSLTIPADMLDITPAFIAAVGKQFPALEELEWAFNYTSKAYFSAFARMTHALSHLKKVTFLSLSRPAHLKQFRAEEFHRRWIQRKCYADGLNPVLKHVRYRHYCSDAHAGKWRESRVYYRRDVPIKRYSQRTGRPYGERWMEIKWGEEEMDPEQMFEECRTPGIMRQAPKKQRARRRRKQKGGEGGGTSNVFISGC